MNKWAISTLYLGGNQSHLCGMCKIHRCMHALCLILSMDACINSSLCIKYSSDDVLRRILRRLPRMH
jgi:hypothetical protein